MSAAEDLIHVFRSAPVAFVMAWPKRHETAGPEILHVGIKHRQLVSRCSGRLAQNGCSSDWIVSLCYCLRVNCAVPILGSKRVSQFISFANVSKRPWLARP